MNAAERIQELKAQRKAIILAHNYQPPEVQDIADFVGDSLGLSQKAASTDAEVIIFCGVDFMAESAKILSPQKKVILPESDAMCPMSAMCTDLELGPMKEKYPEAAVVAYVNTSAAVKALADVCCTSSNAVKVVGSVPQKRIIFVPDRNLGAYVQRFHPDKEILLWPGYCPTHHDISVQEIKELQCQHPRAKLMVHPECIPDVIDLADNVSSTEGMIKYARTNEAREFIVGTEVDMTYRLSKEVPDKKFIPVPSAICPNMKRTTVSSLIRALETMSPEITLAPGIIEAARKPLERMMEIGRGD
ncbi:MAG TPA: quinolinate synthase NadA [Methanomassiliicoccales archaeon]|nr:quinolinate synthase NadA [Methanomassiliicoccales archaeon]